MKRRGYRSDRSTKTLNQLNSWLVDRPNTRGYTIPPAAHDWETAPAGGHYDVNHEPVSDPPPTTKPDSASPPVAVVYTYAFGPFRIDVAARHLLRHDTVIPLTAKVFDTLLFLVKNHERPVTKDELMHAVWPDSFVSDDSLVQNISAVRRALGDDPSQPRYIATLARRGYRFIAPVQESTDRDAPAPVTSEEPTAAHGEAASTVVAGTRPIASVRSLWATAALVAAAVVITAF